MNNFQDTFKTSKWSPISAFSICMTVPVLVFEGQDGNSIPFNFILNTLAVSIDLKVLLGSLFRWNTILRDFAPRLIPISDEYGGLVKKELREVRAAIYWQMQNFLNSYSRIHRIHFSFDFHKFIVFPVIIADSHNRHYIKMFVFGVTLVHVFLHSDWIRRDTRENIDQNNSEYGHFSRSAFQVVIDWLWRLPLLWMV